MNLKKRSDQRNLIIAIIAILLVLWLICAFVEACETFTIIDLTPWLGQWAGPPWCSDCIDNTECPPLWTKYMLTDSERTQAGVDTCIGLGGVSIQQENEVSCRDPTIPYDPPTAITNTDVVWFMQKCKDFGGYFRLNTGYLGCYCTGTTPQAPNDCGYDYIYNPDGTLDKRCWGGCDGIAVQEECKEIDGECGCVEVEEQTVLCENMDPQLTCTGGECPEGEHCVLGAGSGLCECETQA